MGKYDGDPGNGATGFWRVFYRNTFYLGVFDEKYLRK